MNSYVPLAAILVADDNPNDVFFLQRRLLAAGAHQPVVHLEDGREVTQWLQRSVEEATTTLLRPWLLFLDLKMPRMDGFEVLAWLKTHGWLERLTVCVLSTSDEPSDVTRVTTLGAHRFLVKYPAPAALTELVAIATQRAAELSTDVRASTTPR